MESVKKLRLGDKAIPIVIAIVAVVVVGIIAAVVHKKQDKVETQRTARVVEVNGPCSILREGATINAIADMPLYSGDTFFSGVNASARIMVDDDKFLYLDAATRINFTASGTPDDTHTMIYIETGSMLTEVKEKLAEGETFDIVTPNTSTAIHGTITMHTVGQNWEEKTTTNVGFAEGEGTVTVFERNASGVISCANLNIGSHEGASFTTDGNSTLTAADAQSITENGKTAGGKVPAQTNLENLQTVSGEASFEDSFLDNAQAATVRNTQNYVNNYNYASSSAEYQQENLATVQANGVIDEFRAGEAMVPVTVTVALNSEPVTVAEASPSPSPSTDPVQDPLPTETQDQDPSPSPTTSPSQEPSANPAPVTTANNIIIVNGVPLTPEEQVAALEEAYAQVQNNLEQIAANEAAAQQAQQPSQPPAQNNQSSSNDNSDDQKPSASPSPSPSASPSASPSTSPSASPSASPSTSPKSSPSTSPSSSPSTSPDTTPSPSSSTGTTPEVSPSEESTIEEEVDPSPSGIYVEPRTANGGSGYNPAINPSAGPSPEPIGFDSETEASVYYIDGEYYTRNADGNYVAYSGTYIPHNP